MLDERGEAEQQAGGDERRHARRSSFVGDERDGPRRRKQQHELGVDREHVVGEERRPVDEPDERGDDAAALVAEHRRCAEGDERDAQQGREQMDGGQPPAKDELRERVVRVEERRLVVDEVGVEPPAVEQHPRAHRVSGLVDVEDRHPEREPARQQADGDEQDEETPDA